jgi:hypothetical protein
MISKSLSTSERYLRLPKVAGDLADFCQALYPLLVAHSDDFGRLPGEVQTVKLTVVPGSDRTHAQLEQALQALHDVNLIVRYDVASPASRKAIQIVDFDEHQPGLLSKRTKSKFPAPPESPASSATTYGNSGKSPEVPAQLNLTELNLTKPNLEQKIKAAAPPQTQPAPPKSAHGKPDDNYRQILAIVHKEILPTGVTDIGDLEEATKSRCAKLRIAYNSEVVRKAVESALAARKARRA